MADTESTKIPRRVQPTGRVSIAVEALLWVVGIVCAVSWSVSFLHQRAEAQQAVHDFFAEHSPAAFEMDFASRVAGAVAVADHSLWSPQRIAAYEQRIDEARSDAIAVLRIPSLGLEAPVFEGDSDEELDRGPGWIRGTAPINTDGNVAIAGHRDGSFRALKDLEAGATIEVFGPDYVTRYRVTDTWIVEPDDVHVLERTAEPSLTLVTCYPFYFVGHAPQRFVVRAIEDRTGIERAH